MSDTKPKPTLPKTFRTETHPPVYPICPWRRTATSLDVDFDVLGTAFFISDDGGLFVTAKHVVDGYLGEPSMLRILHVDDPPTRMLELAVIALQAHPQWDLAIGRIRLPPQLSVQRLKLAEGQLPVGEPTCVFGYSRTIHADLEPERPHGLPGLHLSMDPMFYAGRIDAYHLDGFGLARGPVYVHTAETLGGISGGPLLRLSDSAVYGVTSTGCEAYGTATDIRELLDWPITFLGNATIRQLAGNVATNEA